MGNKGMKWAWVTDDLCYSFKGSDIEVVFGFYCKACGQWNPVAEDSRNDQDDLIWDVACESCPTTARFKVELVVKEEK